MSVRLQSITWVILAGGEGRRMGGNDKGLLAVGDTTLVGIIAGKIRAQLHAAQRDEKILISANRNLDSYRRCADVVSDVDDQYCGPLSGILAALMNTESDWIAVTPCDSPNIPDHYVERMVAATARGAKALVAYDGKQLQPVFCLVKRELIPDLNAFLQRGERKVGLFFRDVAAQRLDFSDNLELFVNINTPADLTRYIESISQS
jgi:molybdopterin-guanine dinucleotide biosynthesis protein A